MTPECDRTVDVEAFFDGRLEPDVHRDLEAHVEACAVCRAELAALRSLRARLRDAHPLPNAFALKRLRRSVVDRAGGRAEPAVSPPFRLQRLLPLVAALMLAGLGFGAGIFFSRSPERDVSLVAGQGASYSTTETSDRHVVQITEGVFDFDVHPRPDGKRLLVVVPDGEIEDIGTQFRVVVANGITTEVTVTTGEVELRRRGFHPVRLVAGMSFHPVPAVAAAVAPPDPSPKDESANPADPTPVAAARSAAPPASSVSLRAPLASRGATKARPIPRTDAPLADLSAPDRPPTAATASPSSGPLQGIAAEDGAYLHVLRLLRDGRDDEAQRAARDYVTRFPTGLRSTEMKRVAGGL